ncbi:hypothetical protein GQ55_2G285500 [Panicum hallii var. hallii]|uniref:DUF3615 domain-containing protein n=1 Tax=Panicum hallii var. hallii TaxID=1504633 RepID=A0A2T7ETB5_9POAL|nr:hypothetical protein GQ55_2G285500 [Panicum hallii var. hallii]
MEASVCYRNHTWYHVNFWARCRSSNNPGTTTTRKIKRFFAELRYKQHHDDPIVETSTIIEEPLCRYKRSCAICPGQYDILHPVNGKYLSGKKVPVTEGELTWTWCGATHLELPFTGRQAQAGRRYQDLRRGTGLFRYLFNQLGTVCLSLFLVFLAFAFSTGLCRSEQASDKTCSRGEGLFFSDFPFAERP